LSFSALCLTAILHCTVQYSSVPFGAQPAPKHWRARTSFALCCAAESSPISSLRPARARQGSKGLCHCVTASLRDSLTVLITSTSVLHIKTRGAHPCLPLLHITAKVLKSRQYCLKVMLIRVVQYSSEGGNVRRAPTVVEVVDQKESVLKVVVAITPSPFPTSPAPPPPRSAALPSPLAPEAPPPRSGARRRGREGEGEGARVGGAEEGGGGGVRKSPFHTRAGGNISPPWPLCWSPECEEPRGCALPRLRCAPKRPQSSPSTRALSKPLPVTGSRAVRWSKIIVL